MNRLNLCGWLLALLWGIAATPVQAASGRILKVLPHYLDQAGRHTLSPSLFDRNAYQAELRRHPERCSGLRYDIQWKAQAARRSQVKLRLELVTTTTTRDQPLVLEEAVKAPTGWRRWTAVTLRGTEYRAAGEIIAWRASLFVDGRLAAMQRSFLW